MESFERAGLAPTSFAAPATHASMRCD